MADEVVHNLGHTTKSYLSVKKFYDNTDVNIVNATRKTKLTVFPCCSFEEAIKNIESKIS